MTLTELLKEWTAIHEEHVGRTMTLQPISEDELAAAEAGHGFTFPDDLRELLRYTNGIDLEWTGQSGYYNYFPRSWWKPIAEHQEFDVESIRDSLYEFKDIGLPHGVIPGDPDHVVVEKSAKLFTASDVDPFGIVLDGRGKGWLWQGIEAEPPQWYASNITTLVSDCIEFEKRGLLDWDIGAKDIGCEEGVDAPRIGFGHFSENGPGPTKPDMS